MQNSKRTLYYLSYRLLLIFLLLSSCSGQEKTVSSEVSLAAEDQFVQVLDARSVMLAVADQIAEYVVEVFEDSKGNMWFGTMEKGAAYYDGKTLSYLTVAHGLVDNTVVSIKEDLEGNIWFGTHSGASKYDGEKITNYRKAEGLHGMGCKILLTKKGEIWAGTNHGVFRYNPPKSPADMGAFSAFPLPNPGIENPSYKWELGKIWNLIEDRQGHIWFARDGFGVCKFDGNTFTHFTKKDGLCSNVACSIAEDDQGNIWVGSLSYDFPEHLKEGGLSLYDGQQFTKFPEVAGLSNNDIYTIYKDKSGHIWIGAIGQGAYRFDGENFSLFNKTNRLDRIARFGIQGIQEDTAGTIWFGFSGGLFRLEVDSFINVTKNGPWK